jgi:hypothetical protein
MTCAGECEHEYDHFCLLPFYFCLSLNFSLDF